MKLFFDNIYFNACQNTKIKDQKYDGAVWEHTSHQFLVFLFCIYYALAAPSTESTSPVM